MKLPVSNGAAWTERYEALRREALTPRSAPEELPRAVAWLACHGVAEWIYCSALGEADSVRFPGPTEATAAKAGWQNAVAQVLAQMTLPHLQTDHR